ncbi:Plant transposon protein [Fragilaria crotonensis]|nr:Plant transposon protein [Fragilaria crotonensis]
MVICNGRLLYHHTKAPRIAPSFDFRSGWNLCEKTFGILKGRWRILKTGIRLHNTEIVDNIWMTCCALHNMLLDVDGLSAGWQNGVPSQWELESGQFDDIDVPASIRKLIDPNGINPRAVWSYDTSYCGYMDAVDDDNDCRESEQNQPNNNNDDHDAVEFRNESPISVNNMSLKHFREMLVEHFNILFHDNKIIWPRRLPEKPRYVPA